MQKIQTDKAPAAIGPYSQAVVTGDMVFTSGQIALSPASGEVVGSTIAEQAETVIKNLKELLLAAGSSIDRVVKTTCFLTDMKGFGEFNAVYEKYFTAKPARSCVEVSALPKGVLVEIEAIAEKIS
jgi:2-iminobutanoate/2-iminopropanoate deaminase